MNAGNLRKEPACQNRNARTRLRRTEVCIGGKTVKNIPEREFASDAPLFDQIIPGRE